MQPELKISVVTVCRNAEGTIEDTIRSMAGQTYSNAEHVIVDGASTDGTLDIIRKYESVISKWVSEPDQGIYDAMNKGLALAGGDVVGFLNADDVYAQPDILEIVAQHFGRGDIDACFGDVVFVKDDLETIVRYYRSSDFSPKKLAYGWMPAHPALYLKKALYDKYGNFRTDYQIAADYELVVRLFGANRIRYRYVPEVFVKMRIGGVSTRNWKSSLVLNKEIVRGCRENGVRTSLFRVFLKFPLKMLELFVRPK